VVEMPSNLLAHHVKVIEGAGLVVRRRSEADRRRVYLQLVPADLDRILPGGRVAAPRVVFVCTANSARSQLAAALWQAHSDVPAASGGTRPEQRIAPGAVAVARRHGVPLASERPRALGEVLRDKDLIVTVCDNAHEEIVGSGAKTPLHWSVPDPVAVGTRSAFDSAYAELARRVTSFVPRLTPL
jgi:ArsR family transcriptional regulator, arsenate/arsenite/antimonite-responsive transcriptional repressor / arsenate reductase (thioredoxin)